MERKINPNLKKLAELTHNPDLKIDEPILEKAEQEPISAPNLRGFIYVPSINLYISEETTLHNKDWYETHEELNKQGSRMLTIKEFIEFLKFLKQEPKKYEKILDEILTIRSPWREEWLDAYFEKRNDGLYILTKNKTKAEKIDDYLKEDRSPGIDLEDWLYNSNKHGLPREKAKRGELYYWSPQDGWVASFGADADRAYLECDRNPDYSSHAIGVRVVREAPAIRSYGFALNLR